MYVFKNTENLPLFWLKRYFFTNLLVFICQNLGYVLLLELNLKIGFWFANYDVSINILT